MTMPGFNANASLYKTGARYRASACLSRSLPRGREIVPVAGEWAGKIGTGVTWTDAVAKPWTAPPWQGGIGGGAWSTCDAIGKPCCGPDAEVKTQHCHRGLGCNVATGQCEACGGPGQVCCDGHFTAFSQKGYAGLLLDALERIESCNPGARCDASLAADGVTWTGSRRCQPCGNKLGGPCCAPDLYYGLGRCFRDTVSNRRLVCDKPSNRPWAGAPWLGAGSKCVACGRQGEPVCLTAGEPGCDAGLGAVNGRCLPCDRPGQPPCDGSSCDPRDAVLDKQTGLCVHAGKIHEPCKKDGTCGEPSLVCNAQRKCEGCGFARTRGTLEKCCPPGTGSPPCWEGECFRSQSDGTFRCRCGFDGAPRCGCGNDGQAPCADNGCVGDLFNYGGICRKKPSGGKGGGGGGGGGNELKTCSGQPCAIGYCLYRPVWIEDDNGCITYLNVYSKDWDEAYACAREAYGTAVIETPLEEHTFAVTCPSTGCHPRTYSARNYSQAKSCAEYRGKDDAGADCSVADGECP